MRVKWKMILGNAGLADMEVMVGKQYFVRPIDYWQIRGCHEVGLAHTRTTQKNQYGKHTRRPVGQIF